MATAQALLDHLKSTFTGENKLKPIRKLLKEKQDATAEEGYAVLEQLCGPPRADDRPYPERLYAPGTMAKAKEFVDSHRKAKEQPKEQAKQPAK